MIEMYLETFIELAKDIMHDVGVDYVGERKIFIYPSDVQGKWSIIVTSDKI